MATKKTKTKDNTTSDFPSKKYRWKLSEPGGENDPLFYRGEVKGLEKGREETREEIISNLLEKLGLCDEQVASVANAPVELVQKIRNKLQK